MQMEYEGSTTGVLVETYRFDLKWSSNTSGSKIVRESGWYLIGLKSVRAF
jgi:hypothetical protein